MVWINVRSIYTFQLITVILVSIWSSQASADPQLGIDPVREVITAMTLEEKVAIVLGTGMDFPGLAPELQGPGNGSLKNRVAGAGGMTAGIPRLGIPGLVMADGPAGIRISPLREDKPDATYYCTAFPVATLLASSWDTNLVESVGRAIGSEARDYGVDIYLGPALNIHRYPLGGRNFEYFSEDPLVSGKMAAAIIRGVQSRNVGATVKHFVANNQEWNRLSINVKAGERALREIYLKGFEIAVKEGSPWAVMTSYNKVNGVYTSESKELVINILRHQWGFKGLVMTDWFAGRDAVAQMQAGNNLLMPGTAVQQHTLLEAVENGELDEKVLDGNIEKILNAVLKSPAFKKYRFSNRPDLKKHAMLARRAAAESMILLRNKYATLPLPARSRVAVFGNSAYAPYIGGTGSGDVNEAYSVSMYQGLADAGYITNDAQRTAYTKYITTVKNQRPPRQGIQVFMPEDPVPELKISLDELGKLATETDVALVTIGRPSGEFSDRSAENDFYLNKEEQELLRDVTDAFHKKHKKVIVVLNIGNVIETVSWRDLADAILLAWQPGQEAGHAIADVVSGKINPSGKLADTFAMKLEDYPAVENYPGTVLEAGDPDDPLLMGGARAAEVVYKDGIWVGYRYFNSKKIKTAYPFGYGLSYTRFKYKGLKLSSTDFKDKISASVTIINTGNTAGREVVQLYVSAPQGSLTKPESELRAFAKTRLLKPGTSQTLNFELTAKDLASYNVESNSWITAAGKYTVKVGASSIDIRQSKVFRKSETSRFQP